MIDATCDGFFGGTDTKDYFSLDPNGTNRIRLWLRDLPSGTNWGAAIYEDASGYPYVCHIGETGADDKYVNCRLNSNKSYLVVVDAGTAPGKGDNTYQMSVEQR